MTLKVIKLVMQSNSLPTALHTMYRGFWVSLFFPNFCQPNLMLLFTYAATVTLVPLAGISDALFLPF